MPGCEAQDFVIPRPEVACRIWPMTMLTGMSERVRTWEDWLNAEEERVSDEPMDRSASTSTMSRAMMASTMTMAMPDGHKRLDVNCCFIVVYDFLVQNDTTWYSRATATTTHDKPCKAAQKEECPVRLRHDRHRDVEPTGVCGSDPTESRIQRGKVQCGEAARKLRACSDPSPVEQPPLVSLRPVRGGEGSGIRDLQCAAEDDTGIAEEEKLVIRCRGILATEIVVDIKFECAQE
jgi:hypothetical protein